jgi:hypothetical protein
VKERTEKNILTRLKNCQYCLSEFDKAKHKRTDEHIIPRGIIELFPEHYVTFNNGKKFIDNRGLTISDVCEYCNGNLLSKLDGYGKELIQTQFLEEYPSTLFDSNFSKMFDYYKLSRWLLKIMYNNCRASNDSTEWFKKAIGFILYGIKVENIYFSLFAGIHINNTPLPESAYNFMPMQINNNPKILNHSLGISTLGLDPYSNSINVLSAQLTCCIRLGSAVFYCILWDSSADKNIKEKFNSLFQEEFNFVQVVSDKTDYILKCISAHSNTVMGYGHLLSISAQQQDKQIVEAQLGGRSAYEVQQQFLKLRPAEEMEKSKTLIEMMEFPGNQKIQRKYEKLFRDKTTD